MSGLQRIVRQLFYSPSPTWTVQTRYATQERNTEEDTLCWIPIDFFFPGRVKISLFFEGYLPEERHM